MGTIYYFCLQERDVMLCQKLLCMLRREELPEWKSQQNGHNNELAGQRLPNIAENKTSKSQRGALCMQWVVRELHTNHSFTPVLPSHS